MHNAESTCLEENPPTVQHKGSSTCLHKHNLTISWSHSVLTLVIQLQYTNQ